MAPASLWSPALPPALGSFLFVVVAFYAVSTGLLFRWRRDVRLQSRDVNFLILGSIFLCVRDIVVLLNIALLEFPCGWAIWIALIGEIGVDTSIMARAARFLFKTLTSEFKENYLDWLVGGRLSQSPHELTTAKQKLKILIIRCRMLFSNLAMIIHVVTILIVTVIVQSILASYSWMQSTPDQFCLGGVNHLMLYPRIVITVLYVFIIFPLVGGVLIAFECDHPLKTELFLIMACITLGETVVNFLSFWLVPNYPSVAVYIRPGLGLVLADIIIQFIMAIQPLCMVYFHSPTLSTTCSLTFDECMADDKLFQVMVEISREVFSIENVNFYSTLRELKRDIEKMRRGSNYTSAEGDSPSRSSSSSEICLAITPPSSEIRGQIPRVLIPKYLAIYESFIRPGAQQELNLTAQTREQLRAIFEARPILPFRVDCFDIADDEVRSILFENIYPLLLQRVRKHYRGI